MMSRKIALAGASLLALAGCAQFQQSSRAGVSPAVQAACRARVEQSYNAQNRGDIYRRDTYVGSNSTSPFSTSGTGAAGNEGLSSQYEYQRELDNCYNTGANPAPETPNPKP
jgi:hypothetical protein